jgi:hypothetical protein
VGEWLAPMRRHTTVRLNGPVMPGNVYVVVIRDKQYPSQSITSIRASLTVCMAKARAFNKSHQQDLAHVDYVGEEKETK